MTFTLEPQNAHTGVQESTLGVMEVYAMEQSVSPLSKFADSPFTWGGIGVVVGAALVSPAWFKFAFIGGAIAIGIGLARAGIFKDKGPIFRWVANIVLLCGLGGAWYLLWAVVPKPVEPLTKEDAERLLREHSSSAPLPAAAASLNDSAKPITKAEFIKLLQQYAPHMSQGGVPPQSATPISPQPQGVSPQYQRPLGAVISSAPKILTDGQIKGQNFGTSPGELYLSLRAKPSAQQGDYGPEGLVGPSNILGNNRAVNRLPISRSIIQEWTDSTITLKFPSGYWQEILNSVERKARERNVAPLQQSDLQVGYQIVRGDDESAIFYAQ